MSACTCPEEVPGAMYHECPLHGCHVTVTYNEVLELGERARTVAEAHEQSIIGQRLWLLYYACHAVLDDLDDLNRQEKKKELFEHFSKPIMERLQMLDPTIDAIGFMKSLEMGFKAATGDDEAMRAMDAFRQQMAPMIEAMLGGEPGPTEPPPTPEWVAEVLGDINKGDPEP
jgi:hypothetical protein